MEKILSSLKKQVYIRTEVYATQNKKKRHPAKETGGL
jgi:hypothetical protein